MSAKRTPLVERAGALALTNTSVIAEQCAISHQAVLRHVRTHRSEFEEFGQLGFEIRVVSAHGAGQPTEVALLNEDQATYLITLLRNTDTVRRFKRALVKAFRAALDEIERLYRDPPRTDSLIEKRRAGLLMSEALREWREEQGKCTQPHHYSNEHRLCNATLTGSSAPIDEASLPNEELELLKRIRARNTALIEAELPYAERKRRLARFAIRQRTQRLSQATHPETRP